MSQGIERQPNHVKIDFIGIRPGEKLHEVLISRDEAPWVLELEDMFVIQPSFPWWGSSGLYKGKTVPNGFEYASDKNDRWLTKEQLLGMVEGSGLIEEKDHADVLAGAIRGGLETPFAANGYIHNVSGAMNFEWLLTENGQD